LLFGTFQRDEFLEAACHRLFVIHPAKETVDHLDTRFEKPRIRRLHKAHDGFQSRAVVERCRHGLQQIGVFVLRVPARAALGERIEPFGIAACERQAEKAAHAVPREVRLLDVQVVHQPGDVVDHRHAVLSALVRLGGFAVGARIERDDAVLFLEHVDHAGQPPVQVAVRGEAVHEHHGLALAFVRVVKLLASAVESMPGYARKDVHRGETQSGDCCQSRKNGTLNP